MARRTTVRLSCDMTGEIGDQVTTVEFGLDGRQLEIDLAKEPEAELRRILSWYASHAREVVRPAPVRETRRGRGKGK